jgi:hypothetical protein
MRPGTQPVHGVAIVGGLVPQRAHEPRTRISAILESHLPHALHHEHDCGAPGHERSTAVLK